MRQGGWWGQEGGGGHGEKLRRGAMWWWGGAAPAPRLQRVCEALRRGPRHDQPRHHGHHGHARPRPRLTPRTRTPHPHPRATPRAGGCRGRRIEGRVGERSRTGPAASARGRCAQAPPACLPRPDSDGHVPTLPHTSPHCRGQTRSRPGTATDTPAEPACVGVGRARGAGAA